MVVQKPKRQSVQVEIEKRTTARKLLLENPDEIAEIFRDELWRLWGTLENLEYDAHQALTAYPVEQIPGEPAVTKIFSLRHLVANDRHGIRSLDWGEEERLLDYARLSGLSSIQRNAIEVLLSVWRIRAFIVSAEQLDEGAKFTTAKSLCERVAIEMMILAFASFRGDFETNLRRHIEKGVISEEWRRENAAKGNQARNERFRMIREFCEQRWPQHHAKGLKAGLIALRADLRNELKLTKLPSDDTLREYFRVVRRSLNEQTRKHKTSPGSEPSPVTKNRPSL